MNVSLNCYRGFAQQATLQIHVKRHKAEKDFKCPLCPKSFYVHRCLLEHVRVHTGEKPFLYVIFLAFSYSSYFENEGSVFSTEFEYIYDMKFLKTLKTKNLQEHV